MERYTFKREDRDFFDIYDGDKLMGSLSRGADRTWTGIIHKYVRVFAHKVPTLQEAKKAFWEWIWHNPEGLSGDPGYVHMRDTINDGSLQSLNEMWHYIPKEKISEALYRSNDLLRPIESPQYLTIQQVFWLSMELQVPMRKILDVILTQLGYGKSEE